MKYTGSKSRISKDLCNIFNRIIYENGIKHYVEPFVGGANVIENIICENKYGFDNNKYLIALWKKIISGWIPPDFIDKNMYRKIKLNPELCPDELVGIAGICASYNGNWFSSYGAISKTKIGTIRNYYQEGLKNIYKQVKKLNNVTFSHKDYRSLDILKMNNYFVYCDPPYLKNKKVYNDKEFDHKEFWNWVRVLSLNNFVVVSEYEAPSDFLVIWEKQLSKMFPKQKKDTPTEKLFIHKLSLEKFK